MALTGRECGHQFRPDVRFCIVCGADRPEPIEPAPPSGPRTRSPTAAPRTTSPLTPTRRRRPGPTSRRRPASRPS